jgi:error-prone DNA polymerase
LGFRQIKGFAERDAIALVKRRAAGYPSVQALWERSGLGPSVLEQLARADAFRSIGLDRRAALWEVRRLGPEPLPLFAAAGEHIAESPASLPAMPLGEHVLQDYRAITFSLKRHPLAFLRDRLARDGIVENVRLRSIPAGRRVRVAGLVLVRQQPGSANGVIFITIEDETSVANLIVWPTVYARFRKIVLTAGLLRAEGKLQREGEVIHVVVDRLVDLTAELATLGERHEPLPLDHGRGDGVTHPGGPERPLKIRSRDFH